MGYNVGMPFVEAVPNVSEGKNPAVLRALEDLLRAAPRVRFLGADANAAANRTVFTLAGEPGAVAGVLFDFIALSCRLIDMRTQHGTHPRLGAADVCPLVPLKDISLAECARLARRLGRRVGTELGVPVYLYEAAAETPQRIAIVTGSEGGFAPEEAAQAAAAGAVSVGLGPRILRCETAPLAALAAVLTLTGDLE